MAVKVKSLPDHKLDEAYDAGKAWNIDHMGHRGVARERVKRGPDGMPIIDEKRGVPQLERVRRAREGLRYVSMSGVVIHSPMTAGAGQPLGSDPAREQTVKRRLHNKGSIRYGVCPLRDPLSIQWLTPSMRKEQPCEIGTYSENQACPHIEEIIKDRKARHAKLEAKQAHGQRTIQQQSLEQQKQSNENVERLISAMSNRGSIKVDK